MGLAGFPNWSKHKELLWGSGVVALAVPRGSNSLTWTTVKVRTEQAAPTINPNTKTPCGGWAVCPDPRFPGVQGASEVANGLVRVAGRAFPASPQLLQARPWLCANKRAFSQKSRELGLKYSDQTAHIMLH